MLAWLYQMRHIVSNTVHVINVLVRKVGLMDFLLLLKIQIEILSRHCKSTMIQ